MTGGIYMGFLDKAIKNGIGKGISDAVGKAVGESVKNVIQPKVNEAAAKYTNAVTGALNESAKELNTAAEEMNKASAEAEKIDTAELEKAFSTLEAMATNAVKDKKECPKCGQLIDGSNTFCPMCGEKLPELTLSQYAVCPQCGKQNELGTKFCAGCGAKLPLKLAEEKAASEKDAAVMAEWDEKLGDYPKWCFGGYNFDIEANGEDTYFFNADGVSVAELEKYVALLKQNGFVRPAGYDNDQILYKVVNGVCRAFSSVEAFGSDIMSIGFYIDDFDKEKPAASGGSKKGGLLGGLFGL